MVDPIDGTVAFMKGRPHFTICAAVVESGRPRCGVVFNPARDECFTARKGEGAHLNGEPIHVGARSRDRRLRLLGNRHRSSPTGRRCMIENFNSIAYRVALVAAGRFDAMVSLTSKRDWDLAAADIILGEAGGRLVDRDGTTPDLQPASGHPGRDHRGRTGLIAAFAGGTARQRIRLKPDPLRLKDRAQSSGIGHDHIHPQAVAASGFRRRTDRHRRASNSRTCPSSTLSACIPISPKPGAPGAPRRKPRVDNAQMRYFVVHIHRLMEPDAPTMD